MSGPWGGKEVELIPQSVRLVDTYTALQLIKKEMAAIEAEIQKTQEAAKTLNDEALKTTQTEVMSGFLKSLKDEQTLIPMTAAQKKGELVVREAVAAAQERGIELTTEQIETIRTEAARTQELADTEKDRLEALKKLGQEEEQRKKGPRQYSLQCGGEFCHNRWW